MTTPSDYQPALAAPPASEPVDIAPSFPHEGYVRLNSIVAPHGPLPIGRSTLWEWVTKGYFPAPVKLSKRVTAWSAASVRQFLSTPQTWEANNG